MDFWLRKPRPTDPNSDPEAELGLDIRRIKRPTSSISVHPDDPNKYTVTFSTYTIETTVTSSGSIASEWIQRMTMQHHPRPTIVGLAAEWLAIDKRYGYEGLATLQLCIHNSCLILQMHQLDFLPETIQEFLNNTDFIFAAIDYNVSMSMVFRSYELDPCRTMDLGSQAKIYYPKIFGKNMKPGLRELAGKLFLWWLEDPEETVLASDWTALRLSEAQVEHAYIQAFVSFKIGNRLQSFISSRFE